MEHGRIFSRRESQPIWIGPAAVSAAASSLVTATASSAPRELAAPREAYPADPDLDQNEFLSGLIVMALVWGLAS